MSFPGQPLDEQLRDWFQTHRDELRAALDQLTAATAEQSPRLTPRQVVGRLWNSAAQDRTLNDRRRQALQTQFGWASESEASQHRVRALAERVLERSRPRLDRSDGTSAWFRKQPVDSLTTRLDRSLVGLANNLLATMPAAVTGEGRGNLVIFWAADDGGRIEWSAERPREQWFFMPLAGAALALYGKLPPSVCDVISAQLRSDLRERIPSLPLLELDSESSESQTILRWQRPAPRKVRTDLEPDEAILRSSRLSDESDQKDEEWWSRYPDLALHLDRALCHAVARDAESSRRHGDASAVNQLIGQLSGIADRETAAVVRLLAPLVQTHAAEPACDSDEQRANESTLASLMRGPHSS